MIPVCPAIFTVLCALACTPPARAMFPERSVSTSRQFLVYGPDIQLRGLICDLAERSKRDVLQLIGQRDEWRTPIVIHVQGPQANLPEIPRASLSLSQTGFGLKFQLNLIVVSDAVQPEIRRALLSAVLVEIMYRRVPEVPAGTTCPPPPEWLLDGLQGDIGGMTRALAAPAAARKILSLEELLRQRPASLDSAGRSLYCAYSVALLELLTQMPDGRHRLARFIDDLPAASDDGVAHLRAQFPELFDPTGSSRKVWLPHIARLSASQSCPLFSGEESERVLDELLSARISRAGSEERYQLHEFSKFIRDVSVRPALVRLRKELSALVAQASPIYRPAIFEYEKIATLLARGKTNGIAERLARVSVSRKRLSAQMRKIDDYMNWFEATQSRGPSGVFADYMKAADLADRPAERRRDAISVYLDALETQF